MAVQPVIRSVTRDGGSNAYTASPQKPPGLVVGDYLIGLQISDADGTLAAMTAPGGFLVKGTPITGNSASPRRPFMKIWGKIAESADVAAVDFEFPDSGGANCLTFLAAIQKDTFDPTNPITTPVQNVPGTASASQIAPSTTGVVSGLLVACMGADTGGVQRSYTGTPTGMTEIDQGDGGTYVSAAWYSQALGSTAATGTRTATLDASTGYGAFSFVINPAPDPTGGVQAAVRVRGTAYIGDTDSLTHTPNLPATNAGELLLCEFSYDTATTTISSLTNGWQTLATMSQGTTTNHTGAVLWKRAAGGSSDALTVTLSAAEKATAITHIITNGGDPLVASGNGSSTPYNFPTATVPLGDYLTIAYVASDSSLANSVTASQTIGFPSPYVSQAQIQSATTTSANTAIGEWYLSNVSSVAPGAFTMAVAEQWVAHTVAVPSAAPPAGDQTKTSTDSSAAVEGESVTVLVTSADTAVVTVEGATAVETQGTAIGPSNQAIIAVENQSVLVTVTSSDVATSTETPGAGIYSGGGVGEVLAEGVPIESIRKIYPALAVGEVQVEAIEGFAGGTRPDVGVVQVEGVTGTLKRAGATFSAVRTPRPMPASRPRLLAQSILTGKWISMGLPVTDPTITWNLSAATRISGTFKPEVSELSDAGLEPWATWIYLEEDREIRAAGILQPTSVSHDGTLALEAVGPHGYAQRIPYRDRYSGIRVDPADVVRMLWAHIQGFPRGNLGVSVVGNTQVLKGTEPRDVSFVTGEGEQVEFVAGPYTLDYWQNTMIGREIESLATETPFDFWEEAYWTTPARTAVAKRILIAFPQAGDRRFDLRFVEGENIIESADIEEPGDAYADTVYVAGKGEGVDQIAGSAMHFVGNRLRLPAVLTDKSIESNTRAKAVAGDELSARRAAMIEVPEIVIDARHRNAPLGSFSLGDEILISVRYPYLGQVAAWHRIITIQYLPLVDRAVLSLTRRGEFRS